MNTFEEFSGLLSSWFELHGITDHLQRRLYEKLRDDVFDAGASFSLAALADEEAEENAEQTQDEANAIAGEYVLVPTKDLRAKDDIWLVDHCCTFKLREFCASLEANDALRGRLGRILSLNLSHTDPKADARTVFDHMWKKVGSYRLPVSTVHEDFQYESFWFIHDEVGSAIRAVTGGPGNMKLEAIPACFPGKGGVFSAMWCVEDMEEGTIATQTAATVLQTVAGREVVEVLYGSRGEQSYVDAKRVCVEEWRRLVEKLETTSRLSPLAHGVYGAGKPSLPGTKVSTQSKQEIPGIQEMGLGLPLRVFTDSKLVSTYLTDAYHFVLVDLPQEAHVVWLSHDPIENRSMFRHAQFISQFPEEHIFTSKQGLLRLIQDHYGYVEWYQTGYDSSSQLREFIGDFMVREARLQGADEDAVVTQDHICLLRDDDKRNLWITKPVNLARSIDMTVSSNLDALLKAIETGPKVVCKYIENTATLRRRKFDLRFIVAVRSFASEQTSLEAYVYNTFWTRFALEDYALDEFDRYEKHWTVMNYANPERLLQLHDREFIEELNAEYAAKGYGSSLWNNVVYPKILKVLHDVFSVVKLRGAGHSRCRAIYGVDVMLRESVGEASTAKTLEPSLLEITYSPDCHRACKYTPNFFNDVFHTLFLGTPKNMTRL